MFKNSTTELTWMVSPLISGIMCVGQICSGSNPVFSTVFPMKTMCTHEMMWRQMHRPTQILKAPGMMSFCCNAKFWYIHRNWFLIVLQLHLGGTGASLSAWSPPSVGSILVNPVDPRSNGLCCFEGKLSMPSGKPSVRTLDQQCIILMWYWSWFITWSISSYRVFTFLLFQIVVDGQQVISVQGMAASSPIYKTYQIYW